MRHLKILGVALVAMFAFGITATSAFALPDISIALGGAYPIHLNFADNGLTLSKLNDTAGNQLSGKGLLLLFLISALSALGTFDALFLHVLQVSKKIECHSAGDKEGEVLVSGEFHVTWLTLAKKEGEKLVTDLTNGILYLFNELEIICGAVKVKVRGSVLSTLKEPKTETEEVTELCGKLEGNGKGKNTLTEWENDKGEKVKAILEDNFGTGFVQTAEEVGEEICPKALEGKMFTVTGL